MDWRKTLLGLNINQTYCFCNQSNNFNILLTVHLNIFILILTNLKH